MTRVPFEGFAIVKVTRLIAKHARLKHVYFEKHFKEKEITFFSLHLLQRFKVVPNQVLKESCFILLLYK